MRRLVARPGAAFALAAIVLLVLAAIVGPHLVPYNANEQLDIVGLKNAPPSWRHPFGTDPYSRDVLARVLRGARISLAIAVIAMVISTTLGTGYGLVAGLAGGRLDGMLMRLLDAFMAIPRIYLLIAVLTLWSPVPLWALIVLLGVTGWFGVSRLVRAEVLVAREQEYVAAARALGASPLRVASRHVLPNVLSPVLVASSLSVANVIALEAGLSFLGLGAHEPTPSWGSIFLDGVDFFAGNWWVLLFPGLAIVLTVLAFNLLGDALRDALDPRQVHASITTATEPFTNG